MTIRNTTFILNLVLCRDLSLFLLKRFLCLHGEHLSADITIFCIFFLITQVLFKDGLSPIRKAKVSDTAPSICLILVRLSTKTCSRAPSD